MKKQKVMQRSQKGGPGRGSRAQPGVGDTGKNLHSQALWPPNPALFPRFPGPRLKKVGGGNNTR